MFRLMLIHATALVTLLACTPMRTNGQATGGNNAVTDEKPAVAAGTVATTPTAAAWTPPDPIKLKDQELDLLREENAQAKNQLTLERIGRTVYETQLKVCALREFAVHEPVKYAPLTSQVLQRIIDDSFARQYPGRALDFYIWFNQLFAALPEKIDLKNMMQDLMGEQAAGLYDPSTKTLYVKTDFPIEAPLGRMILAHEITHAMQDQDSNLLGLGVEDVDDSDRALAVLAIAEGDATLLMTEYMTQNGNPLSMLMDLPRMMSLDQGKFNEAPAAIRETVLFPYMKGMQFFKTLDGRTRQHPGRRDPGGAGWRGEIFKDPPITTTQILHPEKYLANEKPVAIDLPLADHATTSTLNVMGEFGISLLLNPLLGEARATQAAAGWNGDKLLLADFPAESAGVGPRRVLHWVTRWETPQDAQEFATALEDAFKARYPTGLTLTGDPNDRRAKIGPIELEILRPEPARVELKGRFPQP